VVAGALYNWSFWWVNDLESEDVHVHLRPAIPPDAKCLGSAGVHLAFDTEGVPEIAPTVASVSIEAGLDLLEVMHGKHDALVEEGEVLRELGVQLASEGEVGP
jgi:hypothetical protein